MISVRSGESLSLQYHEQKTETITVLSGEALVEHGSHERLNADTLATGDTIHLPAGAVHRITALSDMEFAEVSTAHPGWKSDVVRLEDRYGRGGTSAP